MFGWIPWFVVPLAFFYFAGEYSQAVPWIDLSSVDFYNRHVLPTDSGGIMLPSGVEWKPTVGQMLIFISIFILYVELFKSTQTSQLSIIDHSLSTIVFICYFAFFLVKPWANNDVFFIIGIMSFFDVVAGFTITIATARRDFLFGGS